MTMERQKTETSGAKRGRKPSGILKKRKTVRVHQELWRCVCAEAEELGIRPSTHLNALVASQSGRLAEEEDAISEIARHFFVGHDHEKTATPALSLYLTERTEAELSQLMESHQETLSHIVTAILVDYYGALLETDTTSPKKEKKKSSQSFKRRRNGRIHKKLWGYVMRDARLQAIRPGTVVNRIIEEEAERFEAENIPLPAETKEYLPNHSHTKTASKDISFYFSEDTQLSIIILGMRYMVPERELLTAMIVYHYREELGIEETEDEVYNTAFQKIAPYRFKYNEED